MLEDETVRQLIRDVQSINLLNSLNLSKSQMKELLEMIQEVKEMNEESKRLYQKNRSEINNILSEMRNQLRAGNSLTPQLEKQFNEKNKAIKKRMTENREKTLLLSRKAYTLLNENQKILLREYEPCLVPVRSISNPERAGQAGGGERFQNMLEAVRRIPEDRYPEAKGKLLARAEEHAKIMIADPQMRKEALKNLSRTMDTARKMNDEEFELKKADLVAKVIPSKENKHENIEMIYTVRFLLNPGVEDILKEKINQ